MFNNLLKSKTIGGVWPSLVSPVSYIQMYTL